MKKVKPVVCEGTKQTYIFGTVLLHVKQFHFILEMFFLNTEEKLVIYFLKTQFDFESILLMIQNL